MEVAEQRDTLHGLVVGVAFAPPASVARYEAAMDLGVPILCDPDLAAYRYFGFGRGGWRAPLHLTYWRRLLTAMLRGRRFRIAPQDPLQLGGDVVLDGERRLRWIFRSRFPAHRPSVAQIRSQLAVAAGGLGHGPG